MASWAFTAGLCLARLFIGPDFRPLLKAPDDALPSRTTKDAGYKEFKNSRSSSASSFGASNSSSEKSSVIVTGTSKAEIHATPEAQNAITEKEENTDDVPPDNRSSPTMADRDIAKKHVRLNPDAHIIGE